MSASLVTPISGVERVHNGRSETPVVGVVVPVRGDLHECLDAQASAVAAVRRAASMIRVGLVLSPRDADLLRATVESWTVYLDSVERFLEAERDAGEPMTGPEFDRLQAQREVTRQAATVVRGRSER